MSDKWKPSPEEVESLRGQLDYPERYVHARKAAEKFRRLLQEEDFVNALGALNGNQAMQMVKAGLKSIYLSGWQTAAGNNTYLNMYPDQSLYPVDSVPRVIEEINNTFRRCAQIEKTEDTQHDWLCPIVADGEAGFGGPLNVFELTRAMLAAGAVCSHWEDQLSSAKKCGHLGGKVLVPASEHIRKLKAARTTAEVCGVDMVIIARTDANSARLLTNHVDSKDYDFLIKHTLGAGQENETEVYEQTPEGFYQITGGLDMAISRGLQYAPYADLLWCETSKPDLDEARRFAEAIHAKYPDQMLAYNCSPSFNWKANLDDTTIAKFQRELGAMGYKFQFITLAGFHSLNNSMFELALDYKNRQMAAYSELQQQEFANKPNGYTATEHQREVGTSYFDRVAQVVSKEASTLAMEGSTADQFDFDR